MEFRHWDIFSFLNGQTDPSMSFSSAFLNIDPNLTYLCGLWLLLLFLCYLVGIPALSTFWETKNIEKCQGRAKRRRKGGTRKGRRYYQREKEEKERLISILKSPLGQHHDTIRFRHLLCPDLSCEICNDITAEVNWLLSPDAPEDATRSVSPLASTDSVTESSFTWPPAFSAVPPRDLISAPLSEPFPLPPPILSLNPLTPLADFLSLSPPGHSLPPEPFPPLESELPADHSQPQPFAFPPLPLHATQRVDTLLQPEATLTLNTIFLDPSLSHDINPLLDLSQTMNLTDSSACHHVPPILSTSPTPECMTTVPQSQSISKPVPENSSPDSPGALSDYIPAITGIDHSSLSNSDFSLWQAHAKDSFPPTLAQCDFNQEFLALHSSEPSFGGEPAANLVERGHLFFLSPNVLTLLERQVQKRSVFLMWKEKEKKNGSFPKQLRPDSHLNSSGKMLDSTADNHDSVVTLPFWSSKGKPKELYIHQQPSHTKTWEDYLVKNHIQLFWGLPSLHSESLPSAVHVLCDYSSIFIFNRISNVSIAQEFPVLFHPLSPSLPEVQPQPLPQTLPQSQPQSEPLPLTQIQPQAHLQSPLPMLPSGSLPQLRICGVYFHKPQNESENLTSSEIQNLEWNVLQKQQESLWGLPSVVQRSYEDFYSSAPNLPYHRPTQAHVSISILPGDFPLDDELRKKLEHHLRKRLIQHRWGLPRRIHESLSLMRPLADSCSEETERKSDDGRSCSSVYNDQSSTDLTAGLSQPESFYEGGSEIFQLKEDEGKDKRHNPENDLMLSDSESSSVKDLESENYLHSHMINLSGENSMVSGPSQGQRQPENVLKVHLSKKFEEIYEGRLPGTVHNSWHAIKQTLTPCVQSHTEMKQRSSQPLVGGDHSPNTSQELSFVGSSTRQMLEAHIRMFHMRMLWGLPSKVLESIEIFKSKDTLSQSSFHSKLFSSTNLISDVNSKSGGFAPLRGSSKSLHGDKVGIANSAPILDRPLPETLHKSKERQEALRYPPSDIHHGLTENVQRITDARQTFLSVTHSVIGKASQKEPLLVNRWLPNPPTGPAGAKHEPKVKSVSSSDKEEMQWGKKMENKSEPAPMPYVSREIFRAETIDDLQSNTFDILTSSELGISQRMNVNDSKGETIVTTESPPANISVLQDSKSTDLKKQILGELKSTLKNGVHSQTQGQASDMSLASDSSTYKTSLTHAQGVSSVDMEASQVLHVHLEDRGVSMEHQQKPLVPKHDLRWCQDNFPPAEKQVSPPGPKSEELGGGDAGLGSSQPRRKSIPTQDMTLSQTLSQRGQSPESLFRKQIKGFFQWLHPRIKCKMQENSQEKGSPISSAQSRGPDKSRVAFTATSKAQKVTTDTRKFIEAKLGHRHTIDVTCPQEPLPSPGKFRKTQQNMEVWAQAGPVQGHPFNCRAPSCKVPNTNSRQQEAAFADQSSSTGIRQIRDKGRHPQKVVAFKEQLLCQKHPQSGPCKETVFHPCPTCRPRAGQEPLSEGTVFRGQSLLIRHKIPQNFQGRYLPTSK